MARVGHRAGTSSLPKTLRLRGEEVGVEFCLPLSCLPFSGPSAKPAHHPPSPIPCLLQWKQLPCVRTIQWREVESQGPGFKSWFCLILSEHTDLCEVKSWPI